MPWDDSIHDPYDDSAAEGMTCLPPPAAADSLTFGPLVLPAEFGMSPLMLRRVEEIKRQAGGLSSPFSADEDILTFARTRLGFVAEEWQTRLLTSEAKRGLVNCSRQSGKSTLAAIKVLFRMLTRPGCLVLIAGPTQRQSGEVISKLNALLRVGFPEWNLRGDRFHPLSLVFPNGSRVICLPGKADNIRGFSQVSLLIVDEASRVSDEMYEALRPMLAVGHGDLWVLSTPKGKQGFFYESWAFGGDRWERFHVTAADCAPRISKEFLQEEVEDLGPDYVRQEYFGEFLSGGSMVFDRVLVEEALTNEWGPLELTGTGAGSTMTQAKAPSQNVWFLGLDLGKLRDYTAVALVEWIAETGELVVRYVERAPLGTPYTRVVKRLEELTKHRLLAGRTHLAVDVTGVGHPVMEQVVGVTAACKSVTAVTITGGENGGRKGNGTSFGFGRAEGWNVPRRDLLTGLQLLLEKGQVKIVRGMRDSGTLVRELVNMRRREAQGAGGSEHDDLALALALACWQAGRVAKQRNAPGIYGTQRLF